jgi:hypothetical protein
VNCLEASTCNPHHFACLHASSLVTSDDVGLNHHAHVLKQRDFRLVSCGAALRADNRLEVATAVTVHNVIAGGEAVCLDDRGRINQFRNGCTRADPVDDRVKNSLCSSV